MHYRGLAVLAVIGMTPALAAEETRTYYQSTDGAAVAGPIKSLKGEDQQTALCRDGTHSLSHHRSGACSRHGGVQSWQ